MEHTLLMLLYISSILVTIASYIMNESIILRFFSAFLLLFCAYSLFFSTLFVGFGSMNVITDTGSAAGDPGRVEETWFALGLGLFGVLQLITTVSLVFHYLEMKNNPQTLRGAI